jgi:hypothetical protein
MNEQQLRDELQRLRTEIGQIHADDVARARLVGLVDRIESRLEHPGGQEPHGSLVATIKDTIAHFETEHPRATAILNDVMVALSNMGI